MASLLNDTLSAVSEGPASPSFLPSGLVLLERLGALAAWPKAHADFLAAPHALMGTEAQTLVYQWAIQFSFQWLGFLMYMAIDYTNYRRKALEREKLPSRHPLAPFWPSQLFMVPLVFYNQLVVWPLTSLLVVWPIWAQRVTPAAAWSWPGGVATAVCLMLISDQMWYWCHRLMHTPWCWKNLHKLHHIAPQAALSATYVHPLEYTLWVLCMQLPFAIAGFPLGPYLIPLAWGQLTGGGAHSGYSGFANGDKHNGHHLYHNVNFGLLMIADAVWGTHWAPGEPAPKVWGEAVKIWEDFPDVHGSVAASTLTKDLLPVPTPTDLAGRATAVLMARSGHAATEAHAAASGAPPSSGKGSKAKGETKKGR
jgi:sterol desaturase/sphingolipid hydroxylase (fatty acid hydroxylase superfamily)